MNILHEPQNERQFDEGFMFHADGVDFYWGPIMDPRSPFRKVLGVLPRRSIRLILTVGDETGAILWNPFILDQVTITPETKQLITAYIKLLQ